MEYDDTTRKEFLKTRLLAIFFFVVVPIVYAFIAQLMQSRVSFVGRSGGQVDLMFYILAVMAVVAPAFVPLITKAQISSLRRNAKSNATPAQLVTSLYIIKFAFVEASFIFGLVVFFISGDFQRMVLFYPIGAVWAVIYWPREEAMKQMLERLEGP